MVLRAMGKPVAAIRAMKEALAVNPYTSGAKDSIEQLEKLNPDL